MPKTVYVVAVETVDAGGIDWYRVQADAEAAFDAESQTHAGDTRTEINLFAVEVEDDDDDDAITSECDTEMWDRTYTPIRSVNRGASVVDDGAEPEPRIMALVSKQGTACSETALHGDEDTPEARARIEAAINPADPDAPVPGSWTDCSDNEALQG